MTIIIEYEGDEELLEEVLAQVVAAVQVTDPSSYSVYSDVAENEELD